MILLEGVGVSMNKSSLISPKIRNSLSQARFFFDREGKKTIFVEGDKDYKMIKNYVNNNIRLEVLDGKSSILYVKNQFTNDKYAMENNYVMLMADIDYDIVVNNEVSKLINYNVFCMSNGLLFNDLEIFLFNTNAFKKIISNYGLYESDEYFQFLKVSIEKASRFFGKYRAADEVLKKKLGGNSILNGINISGYFSISGHEIKVDEARFIDQLPRWSNKEENIEDILIEAESLNDKHTDEWCLSNGHDITEILAEYLEVNLGIKERKRININRNGLELLLRVACDTQEYINSPMGGALNKFCSI